ncbi:hypothetical protein VZO05_03955 [Aggregatilineales bacterium SYSU G02658]
MARTTSSPRTPLFLPVLLVVTGGVLLAGSFLFVDEFNPINLAFLLLAVMGMVILLRGDLTPSNEARTFGITRGSVEAGDLTINAGDIDVYLDRLPSNERLIAGRYAYNARPSLEVQEVEAVLVMDRAKTSLLTFADWEVALAPDMPWVVRCSASLGQIDADLSGLVINTASFSSGFGSVRVVAPAELLGEPISARSLLGNLHLLTPIGYNTRVIVRAGHFAKVHAASSRYAHMEDGSYQALDAHPEAPPVTVLLKTTFGDVYLS